VTDLAGRAPKGFRSESDSLFTWKAALDYNIAAKSFLYAAVTTGAKAGGIRSPTVTLHLSLIMLNEVAITGVSGEVVTNIYRHLQRDTPLSNTILATIVNDRVGYLVDDAAYDKPSFEVNGSPAARGCAQDAIVDGLVGMIKGLD
jgi:hypothetical protein